MFPECKILYLFYPISAIPQLTCLTGLTNRAAGPTIITIREGINAGVAAQSLARRTSRDYFWIHRHYSNNIFHINSGALIIYTILT
jgi:hypothetical protein